MSKRIVTFLLMCCLLAVQGMAAEVYIVNYSFEEPGTFKTHGWDEEDGAHFVDEEGNDIGPAEVPGWESDGTVDDSGVSYEGEGEQVPYVEDGDWYGFLMGGDPTTYQLTDHVILSSDVFTLTFVGYNVYDGLTIQASLYYDDNGERVIVASGLITDMVWGSGVPLPGSCEFAAGDVPSAIGKRIGIEFDNPELDEDFTWGTWSGFDDVHLLVDVEPLATLPYPENQATGVDALSGSIELEWQSGYESTSVIRDDVASYRLHFGTDPNVTPSYVTVPCVDQHGSSVVSIEFDKTYYWCVDQVLTNSTVLPGRHWRFETLPSAPVADAGPSVVTWLENASAGIQLDGTVTDATGNLDDILWSVDYKTQGSTVGFSDDTIQDPIVTLDSEGLYVLKLWADDTDGKTGEDLMRIEVYADSCEAAKNQPEGYTALEYDFNEDCRSDIEEFASVAEEWLMFNYLLDSTPYDKVITYNLLENPGFETGDKTAWDYWEWDGGLGPIYIPKVVTGEQRSGMYCAMVDADNDYDGTNGDGFCQYFWPQPGATYIASFWYKGTLSAGAEGYWGIYTHDKTSYNVGGGELTEFGDEYLEVTLEFTLPDPFPYQEEGLEIWVWSMYYAQGVAYFDDFEIVEVVEE